MAQVEVLEQERVATWDLPVALEDSVAYGQAGVLVVTPIDNLLIEEPTYIGEGQMLFDGKLLPPERMDPVTGVYRQEDAKRTEAGLYVMEFEVEGHEWEHVLFGESPVCKMVMAFEALEEAYTKAISSWTETAYRRATEADWTAISAFDNPVHTRVRLPYPQYNPLLGCRAYVVGVDEAAKLSDQMLSDMTRMAYYHEPSGVVFGEATRFRHAAWCMPNRDRAPIGDCGSYRDWIERHP